MWYGLHPTTGTPYPTRTYGRAEGAASRKVASKFVYFCYLDTTVFFIQLRMYRSLPLGGRDADRHPPPPLTRSHFCSIRARNKLQVGTPMPRTRSEAIADIDGDISTVSASVSALGRQPIGKSLSTGCAEAGQCPMRLLGRVALALVVHAYVLLVVVQVVIWLSDSTSMFPDVAKLRLPIPKTQLSVPLVFGSVNNRSSFQHMPELTNPRLQLLYDSLLLGAVLLQQLLFHSAAFRAGLCRIVPESTHAAVYMCTTAASVQGLLGECRRKKYVRGMKHTYSWLL